MQQEIVAYGYDLYEDKTVYWKYIILGNKMLNSIEQKKISKEEYEKLRMKNAQQT